MTQFPEALSASPSIDESSKSPRSRMRKMTTLSLIGATFFMVSGGPFGLEELVHNTGYLFALIAIVLTPLVWSLPTAMMVSELSSAMPRDGGYYVWVSRALGPFWGFQEAWLSLSSGIFDMALYPTVFVLYASRIWPQLHDPKLAWLAAATMVLICTVWNLSGARAVGNSAVIMGVILLSPFLLMSAIAFSRPAVALAARSDHGSLFAGIMVVMWNYMGWDNASTVAGEVHDPQRTYKRAMFITAALVAIAYIIPVLACWRAGIDTSNWTVGAWADAGAAIGGRYLGLGITLGGMLFGLGLFNSLGMSYTRVPFAMAEDGWLPKPLTRLNRFGAPWVSILVCALSWILALTLGFVRLVELDVAIYGLSLVLEFVTLVVLRYREPDLPRPFSVPGGLLGAALLGVLPTALVIFAISDSAFQRFDIAGHSVPALLLDAAVIALGPLLFFLARRGKHEAVADSERI
jgi:amino acid transporter